MKATFRGGVHPAHGSKAQTQGLATRSFVSDTVRIIMNMNITTNIVMTMTTIMNITMLMYIEIFMMYLK